MDSDTRKTKRFEHHSKVIIKNSEFGHSLRGEMSNFSDEGFYFEADEFIAPGSDIYIGFLNSPYSRMSNTYDCRRITVKWYKRLIDTNYKYGYGAEQVEFDRHVSDGEPPVHGDSRAQYSDSRTESPGEDLTGPSCRKHERNQFIASVYFVSENQYYKGIIENMSRGGFFIRTKEKLRKGQVLSLSIPGTQYNDGMMIKAEIVRAQDTGVGVKVIGILKHKKYQSQSIAHTQYI